MKGFINHIVSTPWLATAITMILLFAIVGIWFFRPFRKMIFNRVIHVTFSLAAFAFVLYLIIGPVGYAVNFIYGLSNGKQICLIEEHYEGDDAGGYTAWRLFVIDAATGKEVYNMNIESPEILYVSENGVVFFEWNKAIEYNLKEGNVTHEWSAEKGFEKFPELNIGIQDLNRRSEVTRGENSGYLTITALDGHKYCYDFASDQLTEAEYLATSDTASLQYDDHGVYCYGPNRSEKYSYRFQTKTGEIEELYLNESSAEDKIFEGEFLMPSMVALNREQKYFVVKHYTTLKQENAVLTAINFDLSVKWRVEQFDLKVIDEYMETPQLGVCLSVNNDLVVTYGGFVVLLDGETGEMIWKVRV